MLNVSVHILIALTYAFSFCIHWSAGDNLLHRNVDPHPYSMHLCLLFLLTMDTVNALICVFS